MRRSRPSQRRRSTAVGPGTDRLRYLGRGCTLGASVRPSSLSSFARGVRNKKGTPRVTLADRQIERKLAESNDPVPAQGRIYIYEGGPMRTRPENNSIYLVLGLGYASILAKCVHNCAHVWRGNRTRVWQMCAQLCTRSVGGYIIEKRGAEMSSASGEMSRQAGNPRRSIGELKLRAITSNLPVAGNHAPSSIVAAATPSRGLPIRLAVALCWRCRALCRRRRAF